MVLFNYSTKELTAKVVFYGPGLCGKTTNLQWIHEKVPIKNKGKMLSLATETDRTLFFDFLPIELGTIRGMRTRVQLYTVPGQVFYNATRRMVLKGADCVVFVCDSQEPMLEANLESMENLRQNLEANEIDPDEVPMVLQYNKRDLPNALPIEILNEKLNDGGLPFYEAVATKGIGVDETLKGATALVFRSLAAKYGGAPAHAEAAEASPSPEAAVSESPPPAPPPAVPTASRNEEVQEDEEAEAAATPAVRAAASNAGGVESAEDDFLESLELQPTSDFIDDEEARAEADLVVEESELQLDKAEERDPLMEEEFLPDELMLRTGGPTDTLESPPEEAMELRRQIGEAVAPEVNLDEIEEEEQEIEEISLDGAPPAPWSPDVKVGEATLVSYEDALLVEALQKIPRPTPPPPPAPDVDVGKVDLTIPVDVDLQDGSAQVHVTLHLTLNLKLPR